MKGSTSRGVVDRAQPIPVYIQLKTLLLEEILRGRYAPDDQLPTEHELCARHGISRNPVHRALAELADEGVILRHRKRGSFVNPHWLRRNAGARELRVVVPEGRWEGLLRRAAPRQASLNIVTVPFPDLHHVLVQAVAEGQAPDLAMIDSVWIPELANAGFLLPLDEIDPEWIAGEYESDFLEPFVSTHMCEGRPVAVQAEVDVAGLWYRRRDLDDVGAGQLASWDDLVAVGERLAERDARPPIVLPGGTRAVEAATYCLLALLASNGVTVVGPEGVTLDGPATVECLEFVRDLVGRHLVSPSVVGHGWGRPVRLLGQGDASIAFGGSYEGPALARAAGLPDDDVFEEFGFTGLPKGPRGDHATLAGGMVYGIFRQAAYPELAMRLLERLVSVEALAHMSRVTAQLPSRRTALERVAGETPFLSVTSTMLERAIVRPATRYYPRVSAQLQAMLEGVIVGRLTPGEASRRTVEMIAAITGLPVAVDA